MQTFFQTLTATRTTPKLMFFALLSTLAIMSVPLPVLAGNEGSGNDTLKVLRDHCASVVSKSARDGCSNKNVSRARNVATYPCAVRDVSDGSLDRCITKTAKDYITKAARDSPAPTTPAKFGTALNKVIDGKGNPNKPSEATNKSLNDKTTCKSSGFLGFKTWYHYLDLDPTGCDIRGFNLLPSDSEPSDVPLILLAIVDDLLRLAGLVSVAFVLIGGVKYITSQGNPEDIGKAQGTVTNALLGLAVSIVAVVFVAFLGNRLGG